MSKVIFEVNLSHSYNVEGVCDFLTTFFNEEMKCWVKKSSLKASKDVVSYTTDIFTLSEFVYECSSEEKKRLIYKMLLERMYPVIHNKTIIYMAELDCFRPGYLCSQDFEDFVEPFYQAINDLFSKAEMHIKENLMKFEPVVRADVRSLYRLNEFAKIGIRDLTNKEQIETILD